MMMLIIALILSGGCMVMAQDSTFKACVDARMTAQEETSATEWFFTGCTPNGVATVTNDVPQPPAWALMGKDREYVDRFIECYQAEVLTIRKRWAQIGCLFGFPFQIFCNSR